MVVNFHCVLLTLQQMRKRERKQETKIMGPQAAWGRGTSESKGYSLMFVVIHVLLSW